MMPKVIASQSCLPVISLEFINLGQSEFLLAGEGPYLELLSKDGQSYAKENVLPFKRVHGIRPAPLCVRSSDATRLLLVFGQKGFRLIKIQEEVSHLRLQCLSNVVESGDWILDVCWLSFADVANFTVSIITAHNVVMMYKVVNGVANTTKFYSETNCILYSAHLLSVDSELVVASGTVFNHILLWSVPIQSDPSIKVMVRLCLIGHEGVISSVRVSHDHHRLVSVSDDRTIRVWNLPPDWKTLERAEHSTCLLVLYGHTARVWDARLLPNVIASIGEDATCRLWDYNGQCVHTVEGHRGRGIWSLAVDKENKLVATGGGDCSIRVFSLEQLTARKGWQFDSSLPSDSSASSEDLPRSVCLYSNTALCLTNNGVLYASQLSDTVYHSDGDSTGWRETSTDSDFSSYSVLALSPSTLLLALGNLDGSIKLLQLDKNGTVLEETVWKAHSGRVFSLNWSLMSEELLPEMLFSCGPGGIVICWQCQSFDKTINVTSLATFELPYSKHRWVSAVLVLKDSGHFKHKSDETDASVTHSKSDTNTFIFGDRKGSLHIYRCPLISLSLVESPSSLKLLNSYRVHGPNGVTCVKCHRGFVYSAGRNGYCRKFSMGEDGCLTEMTKFKPVKGMDWIEDLLFLDEDLLVLGFHTTDMVLYSTVQNKHLVRINCGGGHRSYGISSMSEISQTRMVHTVFIKQSVLCLRSSSLESYFTKPVLQQAFVGREAVSLEILEGDSQTGDILAAIGSEDCTVCLVAISPLNSSLCVLKMLTGHISSVKALGCSKSCLKADRRLLFSGGARASLKAWSVPSSGLLMNKDEDVVLAGEVYLHDKQHHTKRKKLKDTKSVDLPECRVMSLASVPLKVFESVDSNSNCHYVAAGCSDGLIRQFIYNEETHIFRSQASLQHHDRCILCVKLIHTSPESKHSLPLLCSSATDGCVAIWNLAPHIKQWELDVCTTVEGATDLVCTPDVTKLSVGPVSVLKLHQSGINDLAIYWEDEKCSIVTVGDDNALTVTTLTLVTSPQLTFTMVSQCSNTCAHSSSITGVQYIGADLVMTTSIDQRLNVWRVDRLARSLSLISSTTHDVADVSALKTYQHGDLVTAVFCGVGLQYYCLSLDEIISGTT